MLGLRDYHQFFTDRKGMSIKNKLIGIYYELKYAWQRAWRGYDDTEIFALNSKFTERYWAILDHLRKVHNGYPADMTNIEWEEILKNMQLYLERMEEDNYIEMNYEEINIWVNKAKDEFFKLFEEHFWSL